MRLQRLLVALTLFGSPDCCACIALSSHVLWLQIREFVGGIVSCHSRLSHQTVIRTHTRPVLLPSNGDRKRFLVLAANVDLESPLCLFHAARRSATRNIGANRPDLANHLLTSWNRVSIDHGRLDLVLHPKLCEVGDCRELSASKSFLSCPTIDVIWSKARYGLYPFVSRSALPLQTLLILS